MCEYCCDWLAGLNRNVCQSYSGAQEKKATALLFHFLIPVSHIIIIIIIILVVVGLLVLVVVLLTSMRH